MADIPRLLAEGKVKKDTEFWAEGMEAWQKFGDAGSGGSG